jgi:hypothetical protein
MVFLGNDGLISNNTHQKWYRDKSRMYALAMVYLKLRAHDPVDLAGDSESDRPPPVKYTANQGYLSVSDGARTSEITL